MPLTILQNDLVAHYKLNEGAGTAITDHGPNGYSGAIGSATGAWGRKAGDGSNILHCDSTLNTWMAAATLPFQSSFTCLAAFRIPKDLKAWNTNNGVVSFREGNVNGWSLTHGSTGTQGFFFQTINASAFTTMQRTFTRFLDAWIVMHIAFHSGTLYMKFEEEGAIASTAGAMAAAAGVNFEIGRSPQTIPTPGNDDFADVAIWSRLLTDAEMRHNVRAVRERINGMQPPAVVRMGTTWPSTKIALDSNGDHAKEFPAFYNSGIWTDPGSGQHFVATITEDAGDRTRILQYSSDWGTLIDSAYARTFTFNTNIGHRSSQVAVTPAGTVVVMPHGHNPDAWLGQHTTSPRDLTTLTSTAQPTGLGDDSGVDYRRIKRHPTTGQLYMMSQGNSQRCYLHKFNDTTKAWDVVANPISNYGTSITSYDMDFGWDPSGVLHVLTGHVNTTGGFPRGWIGMLKTVNESDWTDMRGNSITMPVDRHEQSTVFPMTAVPAAVGTTNNVNHDAEGMLLAFDSNGYPIVMGVWRNELEYGAGAGVRDLYIARWNPISEEFVRHKLVSVGQHMDGFYGDSFFRLGTRLFAFVNPYNFHSMDGYADSEAGQTEMGPIITQELWVSDDDGDTWSVFAAFENSQAEGYASSAVDHAGLVSGQMNVKFFPLNAHDTDHVWVFNSLLFPPAPAFSGEGGIYRSGIFAKG